MTLVQEKIKENTFFYEMCLFCLRPVTSSLDCVLNELKGVFLRFT